MKGRYGAFELFNGIPQSIAQCVTDDFATININIVNRGNTNASMRVGLTSLESQFDEVGTAWLEYDAVVGPKGVLERTGIVVPAGYYITVETTGERVSAQAYGLGMGDPAEVTDITPNLLLPETQITMYGTGNYAEAQRIGVQSTVVGPVTYSITSGGFPSGLSLTSDGVITGTLPLRTTNNDYLIGIRATDGTNSSESALTLSALAPDGSGPRAAVPSGGWFATYQSSLPDGFYWVQPENEKAYRVFIDNTRNDGGWVLCVRATIVDNQSHWTQYRYKFLDSTHPAGPEPYQTFTSKIEDSWIQALRNTSTYTGGTAYWLEMTGSSTGGYTGPYDMFVSSLATVDLVSSANTDNERTRLSTTYEGPLDDRDPNEGTRGFGDHHTGGATFFAYQRHPEQGDNSGFRSETRGGSDGHLWVK